MIVAVIEKVMRDIALNGRNKANVALKPSGMRVINAVVPVRRHFVCCNKSS